MSDPPNVWKPYTVPLPNDPRGHAAERLETLGHTIDFARTGGGNPPGRGGQQTNVSRTWWRVDDGPWWCLSHRLRKQDLEGLFELMLDAGVIPDRPEPVET
jgi:hypothetical protein